MKPNVNDLGVTDGVAGQVKVKMFDDLTPLVLSRTTAISNVNKSIQQHGTRLGHFLVSSQAFVEHIHGWSTSFKVTRPRKGQTETLCLGGVIHVFRSAFRQEREK